jgi:hypothetical protein
MTDYSLTSGRLLATAAALIALAAVLLGWYALVRPGPRGRPLAAVIVGAAGLLTGGFVIAVADGGPGSGSGVVGGYVAVAFGLIGGGLGWLALGRAGRTTRTPR